MSTCAAGGQAPGARALVAVLGTVLGGVLVGLLAGCRTADTPAPATPTLAQATPAALQRSNDHGSDWRGGPEPLTGKQPTGIITWWRLQPANPTPGQPFELTLRLEGVTQPGATVALRAGDGAQLHPPGASPATAAAPAWALPVGVPSELRVQVVAPPGDSHVHLETRQGDRVASRTVLLALPGSNPAAAARQRTDYTTDARGEPIVRMQSGGGKP